MDWNTFWNVGVPFMSLKIFSKKCKVNLTLNWRGAIL